MVSILVVDDEQDIADAARDVLQKFVPDAQVESAYSYASAMAAMQRHPTDAILVDYRMPGKTGLDLIRAARELEPNVPAILMTAYASVDLAFEAVNAVHVQGFLSKPVEPETLIKAVEGVLRRNTPDGVPANW